MKTGNEENSFTAGVGGSRIRELSATGSRGAGAESKKVNYSYCYGKGESAAVESEANVSAGNIKRVGGYQWERSKRNLNERVLDEITKKISNKLFE